MADGNDLVSVRPEQAGTATGPATWRHDESR